MEQRIASPLAVIHLLDEVGNALDDILVGLVVGQVHGNTPTGVSNQKVNVVARYDVIKY